MVVRRRVDFFFDDDDADAEVEAEVEVDDGDDDNAPPPRTKANGALSKPTTNARLKLRVARVE